MRRIVSFGDYTFADNQTGYGDNFGNLVPRTQRLPGVSGGYDDLGDDAAPNEIGNVRTNVMITAASIADMQAARDDLLAMAQYGRQRLTMEPSPGGGMRYCMAKVNGIDLPERVEDSASLAFEAAINWQVSDPRWRGVTLPTGSGVEVTAFGTAFDMTMTNAGNAIALPVITVEADGAISSAGVKIRRMVNGVTIADELSWAAALADEDVMIFDCQALAITKNGSDSYTSAFTFAHPAWFRLLPGANAVRVVLTGVEQAFVTFDWENTWY